MLISSMPKARFLRMQLTKGFTLLEVLVTLMITATALLGVIELQNRNQIASLEATQRVYATIIASNMAERIRANPTLRDHCISTWGTSTVHVGAGQGSYNHGCDAIKAWHYDLIGDGEKDKSGNRIGSIKDAHGCIDYTAPVSATGGSSRTLEKYTVSVAWRGFQKTFAGGGSTTCGSGEYGDDRLHRLVELDVYPKRHLTNCSKVPFHTLLPIRTESAVSMASRSSIRVLSGEVLHVTGNGTKQGGGLRVDKGAHVVVSGNPTFLGSVRIAPGGYYWHTPALKFMGNNVHYNPKDEHVPPTATNCVWFPS